MQETSAEFPDKERLSVAEIEEEPLAGRARAPNLAADERGAKRRTRLWRNEKELRTGLCEHNVRHGLSDDRVGELACQCDNFRKFEHDSSYRMSPAGWRRSDMPTERTIPQRS